MTENLVALLNWIKDVVEWGTHSFRKGCATFCCSGSTAGAHISAVSNRAGWKQPGVQDTYLVYSDAGDQVVGRIACGLPLDSPEFARLPPMFRNLNSESVNAALALCFPSLQKKVERRVLVFCLASLVHHRDWLRNTVPKESPLFNTALFKDAQLLGKLANEVECRLPQPGDDIRATGLPPHICTLGALKELQDGVRQFDRSINALGDRVVKDVLEGLDSRQVESTITPTTLTKHISDALSALGLDKMVARVLDGAGPVAEPRAATEERAAALQFYTWGGKLGRLLPENFTLPSSGIRDMWQLYIAGNPAQGIRPLRLISAEHVSSRNGKKRFSDFKTLMKSMEEKVREDGRWSDVETIANAEEMYPFGSVAVDLPRKSHKNYTRRPGNLAWTSVLKILREEGKIGQKKKKGVSGRRTREARNSGESSEDSEEEKDQEIGRNSLAPPRKKRC